MMPSKYESPARPTPMCLGFIKEVLQQFSVASNRAGPRPTEEELERGAVGYSEQKNTSNHFLSQTKISGDCLDQKKNFVYFGTPIIDSGIFLYGEIKVYCPAPIDPMS